MIEWFETTAPATEGNSTYTISGVSTFGGVGLTEHRFENYSLTAISATVDGEATFTTSTSFTTTTTAPETSITDPTSTTESTSTTELMAYQYQEYESTLLGPVDASSLSQIESPNEDTTAAPGRFGPDFGYTFVSTQMWSTRNVETSTTQTYSTTVQQITDATSWRQMWTTENSSGSVVFVSDFEEISIPTTTTAEATKTEDTTTTLSQTEPFYGFLNTIKQCRTSDAMAEIAWTAPNSATLESFVMSALRDAAYSATRWTEPINGDLIQITKAAQTGGNSDEFISFSGVSEEIVYTTTDVEEVTYAFIESTNVFPVSTQTAASFRAATFESSSTIVYVPNVTLKTLDAGAVFSTEEATSWINSTSVWTTGNGTLTWNELGPVPWPFTITRLAAATRQPNFDAINDFVFNTTKQGARVFAGQGASQKVAGFSGVMLDEDQAGLLDIDLGASFSVETPITAYASRATRVSTLLPGSYELSGDGFSGRLSVSGKLASATFIPADENPSSSTTTAMFSGIDSGTSGEDAVRVSVLGGTPAASETFLIGWPLGVFADSTEGTVSMTPTVFSHASAVPVSWFEPIAGIAPATSWAGEVLSFTTTRNQTSLPA